MTIMEEIYEIRSSIEILPISKSTSSHIQLL